jgi:protein SCO1/2
LPARVAEVRAVRRSPVRGRAGRTAWLVVIAFFVGCRADVPADDPADATAGYRGIVLAESLPRPDFTLTDTEGNPFDFRAETEGFLTLLFVGFTHCPDVCPVQLASVAAVLRELPTLADRTRVVFITADPGRDTAERLRSWLDRFDHRFVGLRGPREEVHRIEDALGLPRSVISEPVGDYDVGHSALLVAFSPDGPARVAYPFGTRGADYAHDLPWLLTDRWEGR